MDPIKDSEDTIKILGKGRAHFKKYEKTPEKLEGFPIHNEDEDKMAQEIIQRIRVIQYALRDPEAKEEEKQTLTASLGKICEFANKNYKEFFAAIKEQIKKEKADAKKGRDIISEALETLFREKVAT